MKSNPLFNTISFFLLGCLFAFSITSCAKKYDWVCTCELYYPTSSEIKSKEIPNKSQTDANKECAKFGEDSAGSGGTHDCSSKIK